MLGTHGKISLFYFMSSSEEAVGNSLLPQCFSVLVNDCQSFVLPSDTSTQSFCSQNTAHGCKRGKLIVSGSELFVVCMTEACIQLDLRPGHYENLIATLL